MKIRKTSAMCDNCQNNSNETNQEIYKELLKDFPEAKHTVFLEWDTPACKRYYEIRETLFKECVRFSYSNYGEAETYDICQECLEKELAKNGDNY